MSRPARLLGSAAFAAIAGALIAAARSRPSVARNGAPDPPPGLPPARLVTVPGHGELFFRDSGMEPGRDSGMEPGRDSGMEPGRDSGDVEKPTVLLLHGWMFPSDLNWFTVYGPLAEHYRVIAVDARGHGRGTRPSEPFRLGAVADDAAALLRHLDAGPAVAVGYSMGGAAAQLLWRRHPDVVRGLVLCATAAAFPYWIWRGMGVLQVALRLVPRHWWERAVTAQAEGRLRVQVSRLLTSEVPAEVMNVLPWMLGEIDRGSAEDIAEAGRELGRFDARAWIAHIDVPAAVVVTARDALVGPQHQRALAAAIPGCKLLEVDADHNAPGAAASAFVGTLLLAIEHTLTERARSPGRVSA
jgi:pimeloyl-ACP methyl ester carboxylesterase